MSRSYTALEWALHRHEVTPRLLREAISTGPKSLKKEYLSELEAIMKRHRLAEERPASELLLLALSYCSAYSQQYVLSASKRLRFDLPD